MCHFTNNPKRYFDQSTIFEIFNNFNIGTD